MKKLSVLLLAGFGLCSTAAFAQSQQVAVGGTTFGIRAGVNFQNINGKDATGDKLENKLKTGFHIGANAEIPVAPDFYVQPGLLFSTKGTKFDQPGDDKLNLSYIELPVNFLYKPVLGAGKLLVGLGPYLAYGIGGKIKSDGDDVDVKFKSKVDASDYDPNTVYYRPFDAGANFLVGYEFSNKFSAQLNAQLGLVNLQPKYEIDTDARAANTGFGVSVGYRF
jgi:hypothetical protein